VGILALVSITAVAQDSRSEISIQGTGFFTKDTAGNGVFERANETGGFLLAIVTTSIVGSRPRRTTATTRNTQFYFGSTPARVQSDIHQITGSAVVKLPSFARLQPYALAVFDWLSLKADARLHPVTSDVSGNLGKRRHTANGRGSVDLLMLITGRC
jgi:hypothetical protein